MKCPKCEAPFEQVEFEGIEVDRCTGCHGLWFDVGKEEMLRRLDGAEAIDDGDPWTGRLHDSLTRIHCPRDGTAMVVLGDIDQPHIRFEVCPQCMGAYFDAGEFRDFKAEGVNLAKLLENIWR